VSLRCKMNIVKLLLFSALAVAVSCQRKKKPDRKSKRLDGRTTVVSCRVFRKVTCRTTRENVITINKSITNSRNCQQYCYSTNGCGAFTFQEKTRREDRQCMLFNDCNGKTTDCRDCISGPIMPRINECLAAKQEVAPSPPPTVGTRKPCKFGCTGICVGPRCPELLSGLESEAVVTQIDTENRIAQTEPSITGQIDFPGSGVDLTTTDQTEVQPNEQGDEPDISSYDEYETDVVIDESIFEEEDDFYEDDYSYTDEEEEVPAADIDETFVDYNEPESELDFVEDEDYDYQDELFEAEIMDDGPLEEEAVFEEEDEIPDEDINIDAGFLDNNQGNTVELEQSQPKTSIANPSGASPTFIFYFCALGGNNANGPVNAVDILNTGFANALQALSIAPMPSRMTQGGGCSAAYTQGTITSCSSGYTILSPYGFLYRPGTCFDYNMHTNAWKQTGAKLTTYRKGATLTKLGRYLMSTGGKRGKRSLKSIELFDPKKPERGWRRMARMTMPTSVSEHCSVTVKGRAGKEVIIIGGKGRENRSIKLDIKLNKWYSLNRLNQGRRKHACVKATLNGRSGIVVSGGMNRKDKNMTSVEFYDAASGAWYNLPSLRRGRQNHAMVVNKGKLMVAGGVGMGRKGREYLDDIEIFTGQRWIKSKMKLDRPRADFSLVKIPRSGRSRDQQQHGGRQKTAGGANSKSNANKSRKKTRTPRRN